MTGPAPMCVSCKRFRPDAETLSCDAFPDGIPDGILDNEVDHREPVDGDGGLRYDPKPGAEPQPWWPRG